MEANVATIRTFIRGNLKVKLDACLHDDGYTALQPGTLLAYRFGYGRLLRHYGVYLGHGVIVELLNLRGPDPSSLPAVSFPVAWGISACIQSMCQPWDTFGNMCSKPMTGRSVYPACFYTFRTGEEESVLTDPHNIIDIVSLLKKLACVLNNRHVARACHTVATRLQDMPLESLQELKRTLREFLHDFMCNADRLAEVMRLLRRALNICPEHTFHPAEVSGFVRLAHYYDMKLSAEQQKSKLVSIQLPEGGLRQRALAEALDKVACSLGPFDYKLHQRNCEQYSMFILTRTPFCSQVGMVPPILGCAGNIVACAMRAWCLSVGLAAAASTVWMIVPDMITIGDNTWAMIENTRVEDAWYANSAEALMMRLLREGAANE